MVAILPGTDPDIPETVTPADVAKRTLILEYQRVPHRQLSRAWLHAAGVDVRPAMEFDGIEAIKSAVSAGLGMSIVPGPSMSEGPPMNSVVVRPLEPPLMRALGLVARRGRAEPPALKIVREAIMTLRSDETEARPTPEAITQPRGRGLRRANDPRPVLSGGRCRYYAASPTGR